ncbi:MAG: [FeFe] hydrogenase H-cluster radical SAM maturase HydE [Lachnospiraceae bacterium]|nr:[FeFe] hydrogenase H-cluster radical SAM maturase HydE [Lachnospiraceae bacterium]
MEMNEGLKEMIDRLESHGELSIEEYAELIRFRNQETAGYLAERADVVRRREYGNQVFIRGLIELTNYCKNDCYYCGIRRSNRFAQRYRLEEEEVFHCCDVGYAQGFRTFVIQGGEDLYYTPDRVAHMIEGIKKKYPDCAVTLSLGEKSRTVYKKWYDAGADRYLLRHETADESHYKKLHPGNMSLLRRKQCLWELKEIGYQVGAGFMVGSPYQRISNLAQDLVFLKTLNPHMVGIGPFIPAKNTPFETERGGNAELTLYLLSIIRLMLPRVLLPATTALGTVERNGRVRGMQAGANVVMPNLSPQEVRDQYTIYNRKISRGAEGIEGLEQLKQQMREAGYEVVVSRGDYRNED